MTRIFVASSWRNPYQQDVVAYLRGFGHKVYDFHHPFNGIAGFAWAEMDPAWQSWSAVKYRELLTTHPIAARGFVSDLRAMQWAEACVLVLPCGRSAHLEAGWFCGQGKRCIILTRDGEEPELMALLATDICVTLPEVAEALHSERTETKTGAIIPPETIEKLEVSFRERQSCHHHNDGYNACTYCGTPLLPGTGMASSSVQRGGFPGPLRDGLVIAPSWKFVTVEAPDKLYYNVDRNYYSEGAIIHLPKLEKTIAEYARAGLPDWYKYMYDTVVSQFREVVGKWTDGYSLKKEFKAWAK